LGCCNRRFWDRSWNIILIQFFGNSLIFGQLVGSYMKIIKGRLFLCCQQAKDKGTALQVILYGTLYSVITALLRLHCVDNFYYVVLCSKTFIRTAKAAKAFNAC
jgi:hypothetical protein